MADANWVIQLIGRFHPLLVHFPIGLLVMALLFEGSTIGGRRKGLRQGIHWMVYAGSLFAVLSVLSGYLLRKQDSYSGQIADYHQYLGIATAALALLTSLLLRKALKQSPKQKLIEELYLQLLGRMPTQDESDLMLDVCEKRRKRKQYKMFFGPS